MIRFNCPKCRKAMTAPDSAAGHDGVCACGAAFGIPAPKPIPTPPPLPTPAKPLPGPAPLPLPLPASAASLRVPWFVVGGVVLTVICLVAALHCWSKAWRLRLELERRYGPGFATRDDVAGYFTAGVVLLAGSVVVWVVTASALWCRLRPVSEPGSWAALGGGLGGLLAVPVSQYTPLFGGWLGGFAAPWSMYRVNQIAPHFLALVVLGAGLGAGLALLMRQKTPPG